MILALEILSIITMSCIIFVCIYGIVLLNKIFNQIKYSNYIKEKISQYIYIRSKNDNSTNNEDKPTY